MTWEQTRYNFCVFQEAAGLAVRTIEGRNLTLIALENHSKAGPNDLNFHHLTEFLARPNSYTGAPLSPGTKQVERSYLQVWSSWAHDERILHEDIGRRLPRVKVPRRRARPVVRAHVDAMLKLDNLWQTTLDLVAVAVNTGLRVSEIVRIHGRDYDPLSQILRTTRKGGLVHYIRCNQAIVEFAERLPADGWWFPSTYTNVMFPEGGGHILPRTASTRITATMRRVGINDPRMTGHSLRHFYCCMHIRLGTPLHVVQELMGHASLNTTQSYIEVLDSEIEAAVKRTPYMPASLVI